MARDIAKYLIPESHTVKQTLVAMDDILASTLFVTAGGRLAGAVSSGDIRRALLRDVKMDSPVAEIMTRTPLRVAASPDAFAEAKRIFRSRPISALPVVDADGCVIDIILRADAFEGRRLGRRLALPVVIMAGGVGSRLDPFTRILPKPLIPIGDKPMIEIIMDEFAKHGMESFILSLHHKSKMLKAYFQEFEQPYAVDFVTEEEPRGTAGALRLLRGRVRSSFFVSNCDILVSSDYGKIYDFHRKGAFPLTLVASMQTHTIPYGVCDLTKEGTLDRIREKPSFDLLVNTGMYLIEPACLDIIPQDGRFDMTDLIRELRAAGREVGVFPVSPSSWIDVGQWAEYKKAVSKLAQAMPDPL